jgi:hypothetical protein
MIEGRCFCGFIRYAADGPSINETNCHCSICRRTSGAAFVSWATVRVTAFRVLSGTPTSFRSSDDGTRTFCPQCGTPLTFRSARSPEEIDVTICSLERPELLPPKDHTHVSSKLRWVVLGDNLPVYEGSRL